MVSGKVISKEKQEVVDFATVYLKGTTYGCTTNEEGIYHLHAPAGKYTLVVSEKESKSKLNIFVIRLGGEKNFII